MSTGSAQLTRLPGLFYQIRLTLREVLLLSMTEKLAYIKKLRRLTTEEIARH